MLVPACSSTLRGGKPKFANSNAASVLGQPNHMIRDRHDCESGQLQLEFADAIEPGYGSYILRNRWMRFENTAVLALRDYC